MLITKCDHADLNRLKSINARNSSLAICIGAVLNTVLTSTAAAKEPEPRNSDDIEQDIVTARKVSERLQDVPISVSAISGEQLSRLGATDVKDVLGMVPALTYGGQDRGKSTYTIRGVASGLNTTGIYLDDISVLNTGLEGGGGAPDPVFFDIERVEVLKGPQGTLYGGSAMGGAIKYVSAKPDLSGVSGSGAIGVASTTDGAPSYNAETVINLPITEVFAMRAGFYFNHEGGYIDNIAGLEVENPSVSSTPSPVYTPSREPSLSKANKNDYNAANTTAARLSFLWEPDPDLSIRPAVFYQDYRLDSPSDIFPNYTGLVSSYRFTNQEQRDRFSLYSLDISKRWDAVELASLTGYFDREFVGDRDYSFFVNHIFGLPFETDSFANYANTSKTLSQELRLSSPGDSDGRLTWVIGLYYNDREIHAMPKVATYSPMFPGMLLDASIKTDIRESAAFGEVSYRIVEGLELTAGIRVFEIEQDSHTRTQGFLAGPPIDLSSSENGTNPKLGISYEVGRDHLMYVSAAKGFRNGGPLAPLIGDSCANDFAALGLSGQPSSYKSDDLWTYELGSKNGFDGGRATVNGALFQTDWKEIQQTIELPCGSRFTGNAGKARIRGAELETRVNIVPSFEIGGTVSYLDAKIVDPGTFTITFHKGDDLQSVSKWTTSLFAVYSASIGKSWEMRVRGDYQYRSDARLNYQSTQPVVYSDGVSGFIPNSAERNPSYDVANANISLGNEQTELSLFVDNMFNSQPLLDYSPLILLHSRGSTLRPRTTGVEIRRRF